LKIFFDNVNFNSTSGPNSFATRLSSELLKRDHEVFNQVSMDTIPDVQLSFIMSQKKVAPMIQRLDGIYFNTDQDFKSLNKPILETYENCEAVVFQTDFNKRLSEHYFGNHWNSHVIRNGTDIDLITDIKPNQNDLLNSFEGVWCCASSWRPHKRLSENIRYFLETAPDTHCLVVLGSNPDFTIKHPRVLYGGQLAWKDLISIYKRSEYFIHLAWLDHCPNVVVDARAAGCKIICSSSGGTKEIAGPEATLVIEDDWDFSPVKLYSPPRMDFSKTSINTYNENISITRAADEYLDAFSSVLSK
tara:strand:- start:13011 stop:13919 length:909 start_codon:yes stop_codon:yes gene_type:complete